MFKAIVTQTNNKKNEEIMNIVEGRNYWNSNKPLGNQPDRVNYNVKLRNQHMKEIFGMIALILIINSIIYYNTIYNIHYFTLLY